MKVITMRDFHDNTKAYLKLAENERVSVKRGKVYVNLIISKEPEEVYVSEKWIKGFLAIPDEYRCNPFDTSPSGDLFWADIRNVQQAKEALDAAEKKPRTLLEKESQKKFLGLD